MCACDVWALRGAKPEVPHSDASRMHSAHAPTRIRTGGNIEKKRSPNRKATATWKTVRRTYDEIIGSIYFVFCVDVDALPKCAAHRTQFERRSRRRVLVHKWRLAIPARWFFSLCSFSSASLSRFLVLCPRSICLKRKFYLYSKHFSDRLFPFSLLFHSILSAGSFVFCLSFRYDLNI